MATKLPPDYFKDTQTPASVLLFFVIHYYGVEAFDWEPELLRQELKEDYNIELTDLQSDKIQAAMVLLQTNLFCQDWVVMEKITHILNNHHDDFETVNPVEVEELVAAVAEIEVMGVEEDFWWSDEVRAYIGLALYNYGCVVPPSCLAEAIMPPFVGTANLEKTEALNEVYRVRKTQIEKLLTEVAALI
ncbi:MAG: hypothetical protein EBU46_00665 [Nitrosomonadaceae bacterium]|nr:hypothetical protein [Nitrosomonadaceae bacterium]